jgi:hypothetical protein
MFDMFFPFKKTHISGNPQRFDVAKDITTEHPPGTGVPLHHYFCATKE